MLDAVVNIYCAEDIQGEIFIQPLKAYHNFFAEKISYCSFNLEKVAWLIANAVTGIFAYPPLGVLAGVGILVKLTGVPGVQRHNQTEKAVINSIPGLSLTDGETYAVSSLDPIHLSGWKMTTIKEYTVTTEDLDLGHDCAPLDAIKKEIDLFTSQFKKVYVAVYGLIEEGDGEFTVEIRIKERI